MIKNNLSRILGEKRLTRAWLARETGIRPSTISDLYNDFSERISFEQLERICEVLDCNVSDLFEYVPPPMKITGDSLILEPHGNRKGRSGKRNL